MLIASSVHAGRHVHSMGTVARLLSSRRPRASGLRLFTSRCVNGVTPRARPFGAVGSATLRCALPVPPSQPAHTAHPTQHARIGRVGSGGGAPCLDPRQVLMRASSVPMVIHAVVCGLAHALPKPCHHSDHQFLSLCAPLHDRPRLGISEPAWAPSPYLKKTFLTPSAAASSRALRASSHACSRATCDESDKS